MIDCIFRNDAPAPKKDSDFEDVWKHVRKIWYAQDAALKSLTGTELAGFRNIITSMISAENNNAFSPCAIYIGSRHLKNNFRREAISWHIAN